MSIFGKIGHAIGSGLKAIGHGIVEGAKQVGLAAEGVVSGFALKPIAGVVGLFSKDLASHIRLPNQEQVDHSFMGKLGEFAGTALGFVGGTSLLRGAGLGATAARAAMGAVEGMAGDGQGSLWQKLEGAAVGAATAGLAGHAGDKVTGWLHKGEDALLHPLVEAGAPRAVTQASEKFLEAEAKSLVLNGRFAGFKEILPAAAVSGVMQSDIGDRINHGIDGFMNRLPHNVGTDAMGRIVDVEQNSLTQRGRFADGSVVVSTASGGRLGKQIDSYVDRVQHSNNRFVREGLGDVLQVERNSLHDQGRLVGPEYLVRHEAEQHLLGPARNHANDMLHGFSIDGVNVGDTADKWARDAHKFADRILAADQHIHNSIEHLDPIHRMRDRDFRG